MKTLAIAALITASLAAAPAYAQVNGPHRIVVGYADLDLATAEGRVALDLRVLRAARSACGTPSPADPRGRAKAGKCVEEARAAARQDIGIAVARRHARRVLVSSR